MNNEAMTNFAAINKCLDRFYALTEIEPDRCNHFLDLEFSRVNAIRLLEFGNFDFLHDMWGIIHNMNRETCKMDNHFSPRAGYVDKMAIMPY